MNKGKVLLVDDRPEFLDILGECIAARGYQVGRAASGGEALEAVRGQGYDAVVLDVVMPEMDGIETLKRLRERDPDLAVILLTGYGTSQEVIQALGPGRPGLPGQASRSGQPAGARGRGHSPQGRRAPLAWRATGPLQAGPFVVDHRQQAPGPPSGPLTNGVVEAQARQGSSPPATYLDLREAGIASRSRPPN